MPEEIAIDSLRNWIGKHDCATDTITPELLRRFRATFAGYTEFAQDTLQMPLGIHWLLAPPAVSQDALGEDGHPSTGGFLPPIPLGRRMWASSRVHFHQTPRVGHAITRTSTIADVALKQGAASGPLILVTVDHRYCEGSGATGVILIEEQQTIIYRQPSAFRQPEAQSPDTPWLSKEIVPDSTLLFRYSALTFNGHRIHYDHNYATEQEAYPGLVVQGPLMATLLMNLAQSNRPNQQLRGFEFRGMAPAFVDQALILTIPGKGDEALEARNHAGAIVMKADASF